jgi:serine protease Do
MKTKSIATIAALALLPTAAFSQPNPPNPPAPPPVAPPIAPVGPGNDRDRHEKKVPVTYLGVETSEVPNVVSEQLGLAKGFGLVVDYVVPDGPAAAAGVQQNDIIKMLNDQILTDPEQLSKLVRSYSEGTAVTLTVLRKGKEEKIGVKLAKKEVPEHREFGGGQHHPYFNFNSDGPDFGDFGMNDLKEQMRDLKEQIRNQTQGAVHDALIKARDEMMKARDRMQEEMRRARGNITVTRNEEGALKTTKIDIGNAQIVYTDDKGELRVEKIDGKKVLTAKDPKGLLLFSGPVETKEDLDKVPAEVRQRYENLQQNDLPAAISSHDSNINTDSDEDNDTDSDVPSMDQTSLKSSSNNRDSVMKL